MNISNISVMQTDQNGCYDAHGTVIPCRGTGQDGALRIGVSWPCPRFKEAGETVLDRLTGLTWAKDANRTGFPLTWDEAFQWVRDVNAAGAGGFADWRLPDRKELFTLVSHQEINPCLPKAHPFENVFSGYYWTATPCARLPLQAWYIHFGGGRVFKGMKHGSYMVWPVRGTADASMGSKRAIPLPEPRFVGNGGLVQDRWTGLSWSRHAKATAGTVPWESAFDAVRAMNERKAHGHNDWRVPNIRELESLTDLKSHSPALPAGHPFEGVQPFYWSSTTSTYDPQYAWVLYLEDGAVGVGFKEDAGFHMWAVRSGPVGVTP